MIAARFLLLSSVFLVGCHTAEKVAVTTFRVVDTPARFIRDRIDPPPSNTAEVSDVRTPGRPIANSPASTPPPHRTVTQTRPPSRNGSSPRPHIESPTAGASPRKPSASPTPRAAGTQMAQFPTAKPVPGKPGYVYSVDPKGGIVDVTGYKSGDRAKDPYTQQIFIVP